LQDTMSFSHLKSSISGLHRRQSEFDLALNNLETKLDKYREKSEAEHSEILRSIQTNMEFMANESKSEIHSTTVAYVSNITPDITNLDMGTPEGIRCY